MVPTNAFRNGLKLELDGDAYQIVYFKHVSPGKGGAFVRTKLKNLKTGAVIERTYRSGEKLKKADIEEKEMQYLYKDGSEYHFMDLKTYEQVALRAEQLGDSRKFLQEQINVEILFFKGEPIGVELPNFVELLVSETEPGVRGDTASGATKPATLETGALVQVPLFVCIDDKLKVDTRTGEYVTRV